MKEQDTKNNKDIKIDIKEHEKNLDLLEREIELQNEYKCCFGNTTDARILSFLSKFLIIFSTLIFSFIMILTLNNSSEKQVFIVIVNTILAVFLPTPKIKKEKK